MRLMDLLFLLSSFFYNRFMKANAKSVLLTCPLSNIIDTG